MSFGERRKKNKFSWNDVENTEIVLKMYPFNKDENENFDFTFINIF